MSLKQIRQKIRKLFQNYVQITNASITGMLPSKNVPGKLYEAYILGVVARDLTIHEKLSLRWHGSSFLRLKSGTGPINQSYPHISVTDGSGNHRGDIWTDIQFLSLSHWEDSTLSSDRAKYHELDILMVEPGTTRYPNPGQILLGIECKDRRYTNSLLKEILGVRREMCYVMRPSGKATTFGFSKWPRKTVPADPGSCLLVYSSSSDILRFQSPSEFFGIDFKHDPM